MCTEARWCCCRSEGGREESVGVGRKFRLVPGACRVGYPKDPKREIDYPSDRKMREPVILSSTTGVAGYRFRKGWGIASETLSLLRPGSGLFFGRRPGPTLPKSARPRPSTPLPAEAPKEAEELAVKGGPQDYGVQE